MNPEVTVVVTVYRRDRYLRGALESVFAQTVPVEIVVLDDGAPGTQHDRLLADYLPRVRYVRHAKSVGLVGAFNACLQVARTRYVSILHDDDRLVPASVERLLEAVAAFPGRGLYFGDDETIDENGQGIDRAPTDGKIRLVTPMEFAVKNQFTFNGHLLDREATLRAGGFTPALTMTSDWDLWTRLAIAPGAVKTGHIVAQCRQYWDEQRATSFLDISGRRLPMLANQLHRNRRHLRRAGLEVPPRTQARQWVGAQARQALLDHAWDLTPRARRIYRLYSLQSTPQKPLNRALHALSPSLLSGLALALAWVKKLRGKSSRPTA